MNARRGSSLAGPPGSPYDARRMVSYHGEHRQLREERSDQPSVVDAGANALAVIDKVERLGLSGARQPFLPQIGSSPISPMGMSMSMSAAQRSPGASVSRSPGASVSQGRHLKSATPKTRMIVCYDSVGELICRRPPSPASFLFFAVVFSSIKFKFYFPPVRSHIPHTLFMESLYRACAIRYQ